MKQIYMAVCLLAVAHRVVAKDPDDWQAKERARLTKDLATVKTTDGIDKREALVIVKCYWFVYGEKGEAGYREPKEHKTFWQFPVWRGIGAGKLEPIVVDKRTGGVTWWNLGPTMENPLQIFNSPDANKSVKPAPAR